MGVFYFQYWLQTYAYSTFPQHLEVLKTFYHTPRPCGVTINDKSALMVLVILSTWDLDAQQGLFELTMKLINVTQAMVEMVALTIDKAYTMVVNALTCLWHVINTF